MNSRDAGEDIQKFRGVIWIWRGLGVVESVRAAVLYLKWQGAAAPPRGRFGTPAVSVPPGAGNSEAPGGSPAVRSLGRPSFPPQA